jgi:hypothetical protein
MNGLLSEVAPEGNVWDSLTLAVSGTLGAEPKGSPLLVDSKIKGHARVKWEGSRILWAKKRHSSDSFVFSWAPNTACQGLPLSPPIHGYHYFYKLKNFFFSFGLGLLR